MDRRRTAGMGPGKKHLPAPFRHGVPGPGRKHIEDVEQYVSASVQRSQYLQATEMLSPIRTDEGSELNGSKSIPSGITLQSLVLLGKLKRHSPVVAKKYLYPPTLALLALIEVPVTSRSARSSLAHWLARWQEQQEIHEHIFVGVRGVFWNTPTGCASILCDHMALGSLDSLSRSLGGLPELALRDVAIVVLEALAILHGQDLAHGSIKPSQVLFHQSGAPRLFVGISRAERTDDSPRQGEADRGSWDSPGEGGPTPEGDIFDFGLLMLVSALGGYDALLGSIQNAAEASRSADKQVVRGAGRRRRVQSEAQTLSSGGHAPRTLSLPESATEKLENSMDGTSAFVASNQDPMAARTLARAPSAEPQTFEFLQLALEENDGLRPPPPLWPDPVSDTTSDRPGLPPVQELLFNREYSPEFVELLVACLDQRSGEVATAASLLRHGFFRTGAPCGPAVSLREMQEVSKALQRGRKPPAAREAVDPAGEAYAARVARSVADYWVDARTEPNSVNARNELVSDMAAVLGLPESEALLLLERKVQELRT
mmetsp:Transcript_32292/g.70680  ORF Transcript_32292/g.70680 Transcript_32292/m.70680 type:complete len:543 (+) Transcript_32292:109-1737(+)